MIIDKNIFKNLFSYTKSEVRGIIVLCVIMSVLLVYSYIQVRNKHIPELLITDLPENVEPKTFQAERIEEGSNSANKVNYEFKYSIDPNQANFSELKNFGFSGKTATNIIKYRSTGGGFSSWKDLEKIYGIDTTFLKKAKYFLDFSSSKPAPREPRELAIEPLNIELNSADTAALKKLPGIGTVLSQRIIKYRELLGGFYAKQQLAEVYGISDSLVNSFSNRIDLDTSSIKKINLNRASIEEFQKHPYLNRYQAKAILSYRKLVGNFDTFKPLTDNYLIPDEVYTKIEPYLTLN